MFKALSHQLSLFTYSWHAVGPGRMARNAIRWAADNDARQVDYGFDATYGTDTNASLTPREAGLPAERRGNATMYLPTVDHDFAQVVSALPWPRQLLEQSTFIDLGSGKGRAVFLAAMHGFRAAVGIELSPVLHQVANDNLALMESSGALRSPVRFVLDDATRVELPDGPFVVYLYHPFDGDVASDVIARVVAGLEQDPRPAALLYCHPTLQRCIDPAVFEQADVFDCRARGERRTKRFRIGWSVWTNEPWLARR